MYSWPFTRNTRRMCPRRKPRTMLSGRILTRNCVNTRRSCCNSSQSTGIVQTFVMCKPPTLCGYFVHKLMPFIGSSLMLCRSTGRNTRLESQHATPLRMLPTGRSALRCGLLATTTTPVLTLPRRLRSACLKRVDTCSYTPCSYTSCRFVCSIICPPSFFV